MKNFSNSLMLLPALITVCLSLQILLSVPLSFILDDAGFSRHQAVTMSISIGVMVAFLLMRRAWVSGYKSAKLPR